MVEQKQNWLQRIFMSQREKDLRGFVYSLQQDKERLLEENQQLKTKLFELMSISKPTTEKKKLKLTRKEKATYEIFKNDLNITKKDLAKKSKLKEKSIIVYISRIRGKGYEMNFKEDEY